MKKKNPPRSSVKKTPDVDNPAHYMGILLEEIRDQVTTVAEGVVSVRHELGGKIDELDTKFSKDCTDIRIALTMVRNELKNDISHVEQKLSEKIVNMEQKLSKELNNVEQTLSEKIDKIGTRLDQHDEEITALQVAQGSA